MKVVPAESTRNDSRILFCTFSDHTQPCLSIRLLILRSCPMETFDMLHHEVAHVEISLVGSQSRCRGSETGFFFLLLHFKTTRISSCNRKHCWFHNRQTATAALPSECRCVFVWSVCTRRTLCSLGRRRKRTFSSTLTLMMNGPLWKGIFVCNYTDGINVAGWDVTSSPGCVFLFVRPARTKTLSELSLPLLTVLTLLLQHFDRCFKCFNWQFSCTESWCFIPRAAILSHPLASHPDAEGTL